MAYFAFDVCFKCVMSLDRLKRCKPPELATDMFRAIDHQCFIHWDVSKPNELLSQLAYCIRSQFVLHHYFLQLDRTGSYLENTARLVGLARKPSSFSSYDLSRCIPAPR